MPDAASEVNEIVVAGRFSRVVEAAQKAAVDTHLTVERQMQLNDGIWMIVAHPFSDASDSGAVALELKETGADDITIKLSQRISGASSAEDREMIRQKLFAAIKARIAGRVPS